MTTLLVHREDHSFKGLIATLLAGAVLSGGAFLFPVLVESASAGVNKLHTIVSAPQSSAVLDNESVDYAGLMLFPSTNLNGAVK